MNIKTSSLLGLLLFFSSTASCIAVGSQANQAPNAAVDVRPSVILISIDTLRADHLGIYGSAGNPTPHIDSFADHGTVFTQVDSQIPLTLPSHTSLFTSTYPFQNHVEENAEIVPANLVTLASVLRSNGYQTGAFIGSTLLSRNYGLDRGFETYDCPFHSENEQGIDPYSVRVRRDAALVTRSALQWLGQKQAEPVFAFVHLFDLHTPYAVREFAGTRLLPNPSGYIAELRYIDQVLGRFQGALMRTGWWGRSIIIVLSDHGESLGEHGETSHGYFAYESTLHVPLIIHWPKGTDKFPQHVNEPAGLVDVAPTLLAFLKIAPPKSFVGTNLVNRPAHADESVYSETTYARDAFHWSALRRLRIADFAYIDAPRAELYNLRSDPGERYNILAMHPTEVRTLQEKLTKLIRQYSNAQSNAARDTSPKSIAALRSLGYLAGSSARSGSHPGPDPKDRLPEYQAFEKALASLYSNQAFAATAEFRRLLQRDPVNVLARYYLGQAYAKLDRTDDAIREWRTALANDHTYQQAAIAIGDLYMLQHQPGKARAAFQQALALSPADYEAEFKLGAAEQQLGLFEEAKRHIEAACKIAPYEECQRGLANLKEKAK